MRYGARDEMSGSTPQALAFGPFTLDITRSMLLRDQQPLSLRRQSFDVLRYLTEKRGRVVPSDELVAALWSVPPARPDVSVTQCIKDIRRALGEDARWMIRTVPGAGYEFKAEIDALQLPELESTPPAPAADIEQSEPAFASGQDDRHGEKRLPRWIGAHRKLAIALGLSLAAPAGSSLAQDGAAGATKTLGQWRRSAIVAGILISVFLCGRWFFWEQPRSAAQSKLTMMAVPSIAVLPFTGSVEDSGNSTLADEIATEFLRVPRGFNIRIRSAATYKARDSDPKAVGRELGVRYLLLGNVLREGSVLRLNARLIDADDGRQIWADPFDYVPSQAGAGQRAATRIARLATDALLAAESKRPLPAEVKADHYAILGRALLSGKGNAKVNADAMALFQKAVDLDPNSVPALQGYARTKISAVFGGWAPRDQRSLWLDQSETAISRIIEQRPRSYGAYRLRGSLLRARGDPEQAIKAFERALELNSSYGSAYAELGRTKIELGRAGETIGDVKKALALSSADPADHSWLLWAGQAAVHTGDYVDALDWLQRAHEADPEDDTNVIPWLAIARAGLGQLEIGRSLMSAHLAKHPSFTLQTWNDDHPRSNPTVAEQRARIEMLLRQLNVLASKRSAGAK